MVLGGTGKYVEYESRSAVAIGGRDATCWVWSSGSVEGRLWGPRVGRVAWRTGVERRSPLSLSLIKGGGLGRMGGTRSPGR